MAKTLTPRQRRFVEEYLADRNGSAAARRAGYAAKHANSMAYDLLQLPHVREAIAQGEAETCERLGINAARVREMAWQIATADPRELVEFRRSCCRYCWGAGNRYQRTAGELERDREAHERSAEKARKAGRDALGDFDEKGGAGYDPRKAPNADCCECFGDGIGRTYVRDTRQLTPQAARLFAGIKETKEGVEVKMLDQGAALMKFAEQLGVFTRKVEVTGKDGAPLMPTAAPLDLANLTDAELEQLEQLMARANPGGAPAQG